MSETNKAEKILISWNLPFDEIASLSRQERLWLKSLQENIVKDWPLKLLQKQWFVDTEWKIIDISNSVDKLQEQWLLITNTTKSVVSYLNSKWAFISKSKRSERESSVLNWYCNLIIYWNKLGWLTSDHKQYISDQLTNVVKDSISVDQQTKITAMINLCKVTDPAAIPVQKVKWTEAKSTPSSEVVSKTSIFEPWYEITVASQIYDTNGKLIGSTIAGAQISIIPATKTIKKINGIMIDVVQIKSGNQEWWIKVSDYKKTVVVELSVKASVPTDNIPVSNGASSVEVFSGSVKYVHVKSRLNTRIVDGDKVWSITDQKLLRWDKIEVDSTKNTKYKIGELEYEFVQVIKVNDKSITPVWVADKYLGDSTAQSNTPVISKPIIINQAWIKSESTNSQSSSDKPINSSSQETETSEEKQAREVLEAEPLAKKAAEAKRQEKINTMKKSIIDYWFVWACNTKNVILGKENLTVVELKCQNKNYSTNVRFNSNGTYKIWYSNDGWKNFYSMPLVLSSKSQSQAAFIAYKLSVLINNYAGRLSSPNPVEINDDQLIFDEIIGRWGEKEMVWNSNPWALIPLGLKLSEKTKQELVDWINNMHKLWNKESIWTSWVKWIQPTVPYPMM